MCRGGARGEGGGRTHHFPREFFVAAGEPPGSFLWAWGDGQIEVKKMKSPHMLVVINHCLTALVMYSMNDLSCESEALILFEKSTLLFLGWSV